MCLSFIQTCRHRQAQSSYPPMRVMLGRAALKHRFTWTFNSRRARPHVSPRSRWSLTPPSHPYRLCRRRLFSSALVHPCGRLLIRKRDALCCPDFPLAPCSMQATGRPAVSLQCKGTVFSLFPAELFHKNVSLQRKRSSREYSFTK